MEEKRTYDSQPISRDSHLVTDEFGQTGKLHFKSPKAIEFERYKQDCRKRALDLAADLMRNKPVTEDELLLKTADKYYNWLISIPEK